MNWKIFINIESVYGAGVEHILSDKIHTKSFMAFVLGVVTQLTFPWRQLTCKRLQFRKDRNIAFYGGRPGVGTKTLRSVLYKLRTKRTILESY